MKLYEAMYGSAPDTAFVATGWDTIMLMAEAVKIAGTTDGAAVAEVLEGNEFDLLTGKLTSSGAAAGHYPRKAAALMGLSHGKPAFLGWRQAKDPLAP